MLTIQTADENACEVPSGRVLGWLEAYDLTDTNAAKVLNVSVRTLQNWIEHGAKGAGGRHLRALIVTNVSPYKLAQQLGIQLSAFRRSQFERKRGVANAPDAENGQAAMETSPKYKWPARGAEAV